MYRESVTFGEYRYVPFVLVPRDNRLPIRRMSVQDCVSSCDPQFVYGMNIWTSGGISDNPFYWMNESIRFYFNKVSEEKVDEREGVPIGYNFFNYYESILKEWKENWKEICQELLDHHDESISIEFNHFKVVSNIDTSFMDFSK